MENETYKCNNCGTIIENNNDSELESTELTMEELFNEADVYLECPNCEFHDYIIDLF
jgi:rubredoxin